MNFNDRCRRTGRTYKDTPCHIRICTLSVRGKPRIYSSRLVISAPSLVPSATCTCLARFWAISVGKRRCLHPEVDQESALGSPDPAKWLIHVLLHVCFSLSITSRKAIHCDGDRHAATACHASDVLTLTPGSLRSDLYKSDQEMPNGRMLGWTNNRMSHHKKFVQVHVRGNYSEKVLNFHSEYKPLATRVSPAIRIIHSSKAIKCD